MTDHKDKELTQSQFYMWRALFAVAHADDVVSDEEIRFMAEALEDVPFSAEQRAILNDDIKHARDVEEMFGGITDVKDQAVFFERVREMVHADGDYGGAEQDIVLRLKKKHLHKINLDSLVGHIKLELEEEEEEASHNFLEDFRKRKGVLGGVFSFLKRR